MEGARRAGGGVVNVGEDGIFNAAFLCDGAERRANIFEEGGVFHWTVQRKGLKEYTNDFRTKLKSASLLYSTCTNFGKIQRSK